MGCPVQWPVQNIGMQLWLQATASLQALSSSPGLTCNNDGSNEQLHTRGQLVDALESRLKAGV